MRRVVVGAAPRTVVCGDRAPHKRPPPSVTLSRATFSRTLRYGRRTPTAKSQSVSLPSWGGGTGEAGGWGEPPRSEISVDRDTDA
jgi:hypothetical protein